MSAGRTLQVARHKSEASRQGAGAFHPSVRAPHNRSSEDSRADRPVGVSHDFSRVAVTSNAKADPARSSSCAIGITVPSRCPFGGACHACPSRVQAKLRVGEPDDVFEREAERVAEQVTRDPVVGRQAATRCSQDDQPSAWRAVNMLHRVQEPIGSPSRTEPQAQRLARSARTVTGGDTRAPALGAGSRSDDENRAGLPAVTIRALRKKRSTCGSVPLGHATLAAPKRTGEGSWETSGPAIQRSCSDCSKTGRREDEDEERTAQLERVPGSASKQGPTGELARGSDAGAPLPAGLREDFELRFGRDFSQVRIHDGAEARESARSLSALAYTVGPDLYVSEEAAGFSPDRRRRLLNNDLPFLVVERYRTERSQL